MSTFKVGDTVQSKSGSPVMTITGILVTGNVYECSWFLRAELKHDTFPEDSLEKYVEDEDR